MSEQKKNFTVVIPARYDSSRLPGKPLADIGGKPMVQWVYERSIATGAKQVIVATDDKRVEQAVIDFGGEVCMTSPLHTSRKSVPQLRLLLRRQEIIPLH